MTSAVRRTLIPVLYVGNDLTTAREERLRRHGVGVLLAEDPGRAQRMLGQFRPTAIVYAAAQLPPLQRFLEMGVPLVVLAARGAESELRHVTILSRHGDVEELAAVIHGLASTTSKRHSRRRAA